jgi:hypothetical protein
MKNEYIRPVADVIRISTADIITISETNHANSGEGDIHGVTDIFGA